MIRALADITYRQGRRLVVFVIGGSLLLIGIALIFLPGPAVIVIPAGLAVLALEFTWARNFLHRIRREISERSRQARINNLGQTR
jgi:tellurite resistance protein TerC